MNTSTLAINEKLDDSNHDISSPAGVLILDDMNWMTIMNLKKNHNPTKMTTLKKPMMHI